MDEKAIAAMIEEALKPIHEALEGLTVKASELEAQIDNLDNSTPSFEHSHDEYVSYDHVERADEHLRSDLHRLQNEFSNLEYRINEVDRKADQAQSAADHASRSSRNYY